VLDFASAAKVSRIREYQSNWQLSKIWSRSVQFTSTELRSMHSRRRGHDRLASATHGSRGIMWDNGAIMTYLGNTCISCLRASNFLTSSQQASCKSSCQACIERMPYTHAKKVRINRVGMQGRTSACSEDFSFIEKREECPSVKYEASEVEGSGSRTTRSHLMVQRVPKYVNLMLDKDWGKNVSSWHGLGLGRIRVTQSITDRSA
jgi:hypothetical protein